MLYASFADLPGFVFSFFLYFIFRFFSNVIIFICEHFCLSALCAFVLFFLFFCVFIFGSKTTESWLNYFYCMRAELIAGEWRGGRGGRPPARQLSRKYAAYNTLTLKTH